MACMERREMTEEEIKIMKLQKQVDGLENLLHVISTLLLDKEVYTINEALARLEGQRLEREKAKKKENKINLEADIIVE